MIDSIGFDLDGTLWDYAGRYTEFFSMATKDIPFVHRPTEAEIYAVTGLSAIDYMTRLYPELAEESDDLKLSIFKRAEEIGCERILQGEGRLYEGLEASLSALSRKYALFIASNCEPPYLHNFLQYYGLDRYFCDVICQNADTGIRTKGQNIQTLCARNGLNSPVFVGDAQSDADAAMEAGVPFIWASYGYGHVANVRYKIDKPADLIALAEIIRS